MIEAIELKRNQVYIANIVKCRPPNNRDPYEEESNSYRIFKVASENNDPDIQYA